MQDVAPRKVRAWNAAVAESFDDVITVGDVEHCASSAVSGRGRARIPGRPDNGTAAATRGRLRSSLPRRSRLASADSSSVVRVDGAKDLVDRLLRGGGGDSGTLDLRLTRSLPRLRMTSRCARSPRPRAGRRSRAPRAGARPRRRCRRRLYSLRARRWRTCSSDSSRRASIFRRVDVGARTPTSAAEARISGAGLPAAAWAIWSRLMSEVVEMPWTLSLNSSTFDAQRSASSSETSPC